MKSYFLSKQKTTTIFKILEKYFERNPQSSEGEEN